MENKTELHKRFWKGDGPSLILIPPFKEELYDLNDYPARFRDPELMWESEIRRGRTVIDWPTDGIPTVRPNLGVVTIPGMAGQTFKTPPDSMPWPGEPLDKERIKAAGRNDLTVSEIYRLIYEFYKIHTESGEKQIFTYLPDTQGVFDIAHLLFGDEIFFSVLDGGEESWFIELMEISLDLYLKATKYNKMRKTLESPLKGIIPPLVTPLLDNDTLDIDGLERLIEHTITGGVNGVFILGTTGEFASLSYSLRIELIQRTCSLVNGRVPVLVGITDSAFHESLNLANVASDSGADAVDNASISYVDGEPVVTTPGRFYPDFKNTAFNNPVSFPDPDASDLYPGDVRIRANQWKFFDYNGNGIMDLIVGIGIWGDRDYRGGKYYGWDDAYDESGQWTNGPLKGYIYLLQNAGSNDNPVYKDPKQLLDTDGVPVNVYGRPKRIYSGAC